MKGSTIIKLAAFAAGMSLLLLAVAWAQQKAAEPKEKAEAGKMLDVKKLPPAVQKTVQEQTKGATIRGLSKEVENGKTQFELETKINGHNRDLLIDPSGKVLEVEEEVELTTLPAAVQAEVKRSLAGGKLLILESVTKNDALTGYEASVEVKGKRSSFVMGPDGKALPKKK
jgi:hypothetical protein